MNKYRSRIRERAEQFFNRFIANASPNIGPYDEFNNSIWEDDMLHLAKLSVDAEAEAFKLGYIQGRCDYDMGITHDCITHHLKCHDLIPSSEPNIEQEGGRNVSWPPESF